MTDKSSSPSATNGESPDEWYEREKTAFRAWWESDDNEKTFSSTPTMAAGAGWFARAEAAPETAPIVPCLAPNGCTTPEWCARNGDACRVKTPVSEIAQKPPEGTHGEVIHLPDGLHKDTQNLVMLFAEAMAYKLNKAQEKYGYDNGWAIPSAEWEQKCRAHLLEHLAKGDPRDVANYCAFMWHHGWITSAPSATPRSATTDLGKLVEGWQAEEDAVNRDAARYRWLRDAPTGDQLNDITDAYWESPEDFDETVDKAMKEAE